MDSEAAASAASAATRPRLSRAQRRRPAIRRCGTLRTAWRGASRRPSSCRPLRRTMRSSRWRSWTRSTPLVRAEAGAAHPDEGFCHAALTGPTSLPPPPPLPTIPIYIFLCRDCAQTCGWSGGEGRDASSALGSDEAGDDDIDKAKRLTIVRAYEVDRGDGGGEFFVIITALLGHIRTNKNLCCGLKKPISHERPL
jgi:hypothetical protein